LNLAFIPRRGFMDSSQQLVAEEGIESIIFHMRGEKVIIDADLARLYGVPTKRLNEQVKRNKDRFPADFMFQLTAQEKSEVVANCDHLINLKFSRGLAINLKCHFGTSRWCRKQGIDG
jgi:hypothetical protein